MDSSSIRRRSLVLLTLTLFAILALVILANYFTRQNAVPLPGTETEFSENSFSAVSANAAIAYTVDAQRGVSEKRMNADH